MQIDHHRLPKYSYLYCLLKFDKTTTTAINRIFFKLINQGKILYVTIFYVHLGVLFLYPIKVMHVNHDDDIGERPYCIDGYVKSVLFWVLAVFQTTNRIKSFIVD
jgi:hypothetical protein